MENHAEDEYQTSTWLSIGWEEGDGGRKGGDVVGETVKETVQQAHREGSMRHTKDGDTLLH